MNNITGVFSRSAKALRLAFFASSWLLCVSPAAQTTNSVDCSESGLRFAFGHGGGPYTFKCGGTNTITLTNTIVVSKDTTLDGTGQTMAISGGSRVRLFTVNPGIKCTLMNLALISGEDSGAGGTNGSPGLSGGGGAIYNNAGIVTLVSCTLSNHTAAGGSGGNGVVQLSGNGGNGGSGGNASGGAVFNNGGTLLLTNCAFFGNAATAGAGGIGADGGSSGNGNSGGNGGAGGTGAGGAIYNAATGSVVAYDCTFASNRVSGANGGDGGNGTGLGSNGANGPPGAGLCGGIYNDGGNLTLLFSTFNGNSGGGANGGNGKAGAGEADGSGGTPGSAASGGAIFNSGATLVATNCTFFANFVGGGNGGNGGDGGNFGFGGNGGSGGLGGAGNGGGIFNTANGQAILVNCTISDNNAQGGIGGNGGAAGSGLAKTGSGGTPGANNGGGIANSTGTITLKNTLLGFTTYGGNGAGPITDGGYNLSDDASVDLSATGSLSGTNVQLDLGLLASNGGPTQTLRITTSDSLVIDAGDDAACLAVDQRHYARSGRCDIGAFEFNGFVPTAALTIRRQTSQVVLSWTTAISGYSLQSNPNLSPTNWTALTNVPAVITNANVVTDTASDPRRFYRLIK
ncbi:MAG: hypothetical protein DME19_05485 [Verrucomicrobia bacterium]|nr:MAG: hypothetical protein DME19_05485 [Verrucomicrobiota bacterium]